MQQIYIDIYCLLFLRGIIVYHKHLRLHRIIRQGSSARDFVPVQSFKNGGILYVFPVFETAEMVQKIRLDPLTQLCGVALRLYGVKGVWDGKPG